MKLFKIAHSFSSPFKRPTKEWKTNTYIEYLVELENGQRVFMSEKEIRNLKENQKS